MSLLQARPAQVFPARDGRWLVLVGEDEAALMPMAEAKNPRRDAPFALGVVLVGITILYTTIQVIVMGASFGFVTEGAEFIEDGIPHLRMRRTH